LSRRGGGTSSETLRKGLLQGKAGYLSIEYWVQKKEMGEGLPSILETAESHNVRKSYETRQELGTGAMPRPRNSGIPRQRPLPKSSKRKSPSQHRKGGSRHDVRLVVTRLGGNRGLERWERAEGLESARPSRNGYHKSSHALNSGRSREWGFGKENCT